MNVRSHVRSTNEHQTGHVQVEILDQISADVSLQKQSNERCIANDADAEMRSMGVENQYRVLFPERV